MIRLKKSPVVFDEDNHTYHLNGKRLLGITGLIHSILGLGVYPDATDFAKDYTIPRAGSRGTAVHHAIQTYDQLGIRQTTQIVHTRYGCEKRNNTHYEYLKWDVTDQLDAYIRHLNSGFKALANELTVSDNKKWASQIDNLWLNERTGGIWLVDTKTNNLKKYPLCGYFNPNYFSNSKDALKEYLSWQLSIYAELFEAENPGIKVEGLACNWLNHEENGELWEIIRKPSELVWALLETEYVIGENGATYFHPNPALFGVNPNLPAESENRTPIVAPKVVEYFTSLLKTYKETEAKLEEAKKSLREAMTQHKVKSCDFGSFSATIGADSVSTSFDSKSFKADHPELYKKYAVQRAKKGSFTIKLKDNEQSK